MGYDGSINIDTRIDGDGFSKGIKTLEGLATKAIGVMTAAGGAASVVGANFEAAMSQVASVSGAAGSEMDALTAKAEEMGAKTKFSATQSAEALNYMAMAGWNSQQMLEGLDGIMNLAAASRESLGLVSDIATDSLTAFGMKAEDSSRFADILAQASNRSNTNVAMMGETFKYVAPLCGALGYSAEDAAVAIGLMANAGIKSEQAGTTLRAALTNLASPTDQMASAMERYRISLTDAGGQAKPLVEVMENLRTSLGGLSEIEQAAAASAIFGKEAMSGMLAIVNAAPEDFESLTQSIRNCDGAAEQMAETMQDNLKGDLTILGSAAEGMGIAIYDGMQEPLRDTVQLAADAVSDITKSVKAGQTPLAALTKNGVKALTSALQSGIKILAWAAEHIDALGAVAVTATAALAANTAVAKGQMIWNEINAVWQIGAEILKKMRDGATLHAAAETVSAAATKAASAAKEGETIATTKAAVAQGVLNSTLAACPIVWIITAIAAAVVGLIAWNSAISDSTSKTREQTEALDQLIEKNDEAAQSARDLIEEQKNARKDREAEFAVTDDLIEQLEELTQKEEKTAGEKKQISLLVDQLNQKVSGLNLAYNEQTDSLNMAVSALKAYSRASKEQILLEDAAEDRAELIKQEAKQEELLNQEKTKRVELEKEYQRVLANAPKPEDYIDSREYRVAFNAHVIQSGYSVSDFSLLESSIEDSIDAEQRHQTELEHTQSALGEVDAKIDQYSESLGEQEQASRTAAGSVEELRAAQEEEAKMLEEISELAQDYADITTNAFDKIEQKQDVSLSSMIKNMKENQKAVADFSKNMATLEGSGLLTQETLDYLYDLGPEYSKAIKEMADAVLTDTKESRQKLIDFEDVRQAGIDSAAELAKMQVRGYTDALEGSTAAEDAAGEKVDRTYEIIDGRVAQNGVILQEAGASIDRQLAGGISGSGNAEQAAGEKVADAYQVIDGRIVQESAAMQQAGAAIGGNIAAGVEQSGEQISSAVEALLAPAGEMIGGATGEMQSTFAAFAEWLNGQYTVILLNWQTLMMLFHDTGIFQTTKMVEGMQEQLDRLEGMGASAGRRMMDSLSMAIAGRAGAVINQVQQVMDQVNAAMSGSNGRAGGGNSKGLSGTTNNNSTTINQNFYTPTAGSLATYNAAKDALANALYQ